jgi:hypothetical protein
MWRRGGEIDGEVRLEIIFADLAAGIEEGLGLALAGRDLSALPTCDAGFGRGRQDSAVPPRLDPPRPSYGSDMSPSASAANASTVARTIAFRRIIRVSTPSLRRRE